MYFRPIWQIKLQDVAIVTNYFTEQSILTHIEISTTNLNISSFTTGMERCLLYADSANDSIYDYVIRPT